MGKLLLALVPCIFLICTIKTVYGGIVEDFNGALKDLEDIRVKAQAAFDKYSNSIGAKKKAASDHYWKKVNPKYPETNTYLSTSRNDFLGKKLGPETNTKSKINEDRRKTIGDAKTAPLLKKTDEKFEKFIKFSQTESKKLANIGERIKEQIKKLKETDELIAGLKKRADGVVIEDPDVKKLRKTLHLITRQIQNMQSNEEEKTRSGGVSGIKQIRTRYVGEKSYHSSSHSGRSFASIHDHSNNKRVCGLGEFIAVLNGVEFRTRHNDFELRSAVVDDTTFNKVKYIEFPDVPPEVLQKKSVDGQINEMVEWFRAFKNQDKSKRDYTKYFKPILCYLEGAWTTKEGDNIDEPFASDRHSINAKSWFELQEKVRFTSYSGTKDLLENLAWLPTSIMGFDDKDKPMFAQWNYRILCHPLKNDLPTSFLKPILDPHSQKMNNWKEDKLEESRAIRFDLEGMSFDKKRRDTHQTYTLLDSLMEEIPGKNNHGAFLPAQGFDADILSANPTKEGKKLNGAYYHRPYKLSSSDAMGLDTSHRTYSDRLYVAMTTQDRIAGPSYVDDKGKTIRAKVSYAIPMEIIYLTPLAKWNPHGIAFEELGEVKGTGSKSNPFTSGNRKTFFQTPSSFYTGTSESDAADTSRSGGVFIKTQKGDVVNTQASGVRTLFPKIADIDGIIRQRYPIMPIHGEGSTLWKRLNAFQDSMPDYKTHVSRSSIYLIVGHSHSDIVTDHTHLIQVNDNQVNDLQTGKIASLTVTTTKAIGHTHVLKISMNGKEFVVQSCDNNNPNSDSTVCFDHHPATLVKDV